MSEENTRGGERGQALGRLLRDAREVKGKTAVECAEILDVDDDLYASYEAGTASPTLPELELLSYFLGVPLTYFWSEQLLSEQISNGHTPPADDITVLRDRIIGAQVRQARHAARLSVPDLANALGHSPERMAAYEFGQWPIPLPELEIIAGRLGLGVEHFFESEGTIGEWHSLHRARESMQQLPHDLRDFISRPANQSYLRLAYKLSLMPVERLRAIAESLLDLTF